MKKITLILLILVSLMLSACSALDEVENSIEYVTTATEHINNLSSFAEEAPQLIENAINNSEHTEELETQLSTIKYDIQAFIEMNDIPSIAEDIHQEMVNKNEILLGEIDKVLENGNLALDKLENTQIFNTVNEVTNLIDQIETLTQ